MCEVNHEFSFYISNRQINFHCCTLVLLQKKKITKKKVERKLKWKFLTRNASSFFALFSRFDNHGGGWGYSGHSIEAIRFMVDTGNSLSDQQNIFPINSKYDNRLLGAVHKLCRLKIGDFWPPPPLVVLSRVYVINRLWGNPPSPYRDDIVYGRPLIWITCSERAILHQIVLNASRNSK